MGNILRDKYGPRGDLVTSDYIDTDGTNPSPETIPDQLSTDDD